MKKVLVALICTALVLSGCGNMSNLAKGTAIGGGSGAALGAGVGALIGKDGKSTAIGAAIGTAVGAGVGTALVGLILSAAGYDGTLATQTPKALSCINALFIYAPLLVYGIQLILSLIYKLDNQMPQILKDLDERRAAAKAKA